MAGELKTPPSTSALFAKTPTHSRAIADHPDHRFQVNHDLLYECEFERGAFVSAHLQRLQNGFFTDSNLHNEDTLHVTFAAITFTFHPITSSGSSDHRFESAVIEIAAKSKGLPLRFLKHAPHMAFGRISSSNLKWNFSLGATVGINNSPAKAAVSPGLGFEKDTVVGTMMKIQGSTRSTQLDIKDKIAHAVAPPRIPDTKLVWTLEENTQQKAGIPREFTFVFLMERPVHSSPQLQGEEKAKIDVNTRSSSIYSRIYSTPLGERTPHGGSLSEIMVEQSVGIEMTSGKGGYDSFLKFPDPLEHPLEPGNGMIANLRAEANRIMQTFHLSDDPPEDYRIMEKTHAQQHQDNYYSSIFKEVTFSIAVKPQIAGLNIPKSLFEHSEQHTTVHGEVGQKFSTASVAHPDETNGELPAVDELYNFTKLPFSFEELIELPGRAITSEEPWLPTGK